MFCEQCGARNDDDALFCRQCGSPLRRENDQYPGGQPADPVYGDGLYSGQADQNQQYGGEPGYQNGQYDGNPGYQNGQYGGNAGYQNGPYGENQGYGNQQYGSNSGYQNYGDPQDRRQRKPIPKTAFVIGAEVIAAVALVIGSAKIMEKKCSPETAALEFWKAAAEADWSTAYDYCEFPDSEMLTKQMFVNAHASDTDTIDYKSVEVTDAASVAADQLDSIGSLFGFDTDSLIDSAVGNTYVITYQEVGESETKYEYLNLSKTGKKQFLFWDEWKVTSSELYAKDVNLNVPAEAEVALNGETVSSEYEAADPDDSSRKEITFPYLFAGDYQMEITEEGMRTYRTVLAVDEYGVDTSYYDLKPSSEILESLSQQAGEDIQTILEAAVDGKSFAKIEELFSSDTLVDGDAQDDYESLIEQIKGNGSTSGVITFSLDNMKVSSEGDASDQGIELTVTADRSVTYRRYYGSGSDDDNITMYCDYVKEDGEWKLTNMPVNSGHIY